MPGRVRRRMQVIPIEQIEASVYEIPTETPESDGTAAWSKTTLVLVHVTADSHSGLGYTYASRATAVFVQEVLAEAIRGFDAFDIPAAYAAMLRALRNQGRPGVASMALSAVDTALWDLKARLLDVSLADLFGSLREGIPVYGSGGFTSYSLPELERHMADWHEHGVTKAKIKVGRNPAEDPARVRAAKAAFGVGDLFVDANGAYTRKQALAMAEQFAESGVIWFEEPVSSDDLEGLHLVRDRAPAGMAVAAGEYGYDPVYFRRMLEAEAVDVLQADATRCGGFTGLVQAEALCRARSMPLSSHCAPALQVAVMCSLPQAVHMEYFYDHMRIENMLFEGAPALRDGRLVPDRTVPGLGLELKYSDARKYAA